MSHTVFRNSNLFCLNCGGESKLKYPISVDDMAAKADAFEKLHAECPKTWEEPMANMNLSMEERAKWWMEAGERGSSSESIWHVMMGTGEGRGMCPADSGDFKRCRNLLRSVPEWRREMHRMKDVSPAWSNLVDIWDQLDEMYERREEPGVAREMYELIKKATT